MSLCHAPPPQPPSESPDHMIGEASVSSTHPVLLAGKAILTYTLRKKGTKAVTGAVPVQKVNFCPF